ncbi:FIMAH domain-containing protein [Micromonospora sp. NPDC005806]|uniref:FIMAH domain-containing protein n=1 Tax=Micromonospora sp. NPDC005806 TaxID=3364234 RepID=UPI00368A82D5
MSATPDRPHAEPPTSMLPLFGATRGRHRATEDGYRLMWLAVAGAAVVLLIATLTVVLAGGGDTDGARPEVAATALPDESGAPDDPWVTEEASPTPSAVPSPSSPAPRAGADAAKLLAELGSKVDGLVQQGQLRRKDGQDLHRRLRDAGRALAAGDTGRARAKLSDFTEVLVNLRSSGRISASGYETLVAGTSRLAQALR